MAELAISVVVPTHNRAALLPNLLRRLFEQDLGRPYEIIVVDDSSTDDTPRVLADAAASAPQLRCFRLDDHEGAAAARNLGWRHALAEHVAFTDDDCEPEPGWLRALLAAHAEGADIVQGRTRPDVAAYGERGTFSHWINVKEFDQRFETCNISYRRVLLEAVDGFDEDFGTSRGGAPFGEDADLGWRSVARGARAVFAEDASVIHPMTPSSWRRHIRAMLRRYRLPYFVRRHPAYRNQLRYRFILSRAHVPALCVVIGAIPLAVAPGWITAAVAVVGCVPYIRFRLGRGRLPGKRKRYPIVWVGAWLADFTEICVLVAGSIRWRTLII